MNRKRHEHRWSFEWLGGWHIADESWVALGKSADNKKSLSIKAKKKGFRGSTIGDCKT